MATFERVDAFFDQLKYKYIDILQNFGRDLFFVDGDALLAYVLAEFEGSLASFQLLPVVFRYEQVLHRFKELGAQFRVFFLGIYEHWGWTGEPLRACM
jgi:hypothetical protein